jgi:hypothetical protein
MAGYRKLLFGELLSPLRVGFYNFVRHVSASITCFAIRLLYANMHKKSVLILIYLGKRLKKVASRMLATTRFSDLREREC